MKPIQSMLGLILLLPACSPFAIREQGVEDFTVGPFPTFWHVLFERETWKDSPSPFPDPALSDMPIACWRYSDGGARCAPVYGTDDFPEPTVDDMHWSTEEPVEQVLHTPFGPVWIEASTRRLRAHVTCRHAAEAVRVCPGGTVPPVHELGPVEQVTTTWYQVCALTEGGVRCYPGFEPELPFEPVDLVSAGTGFDTCALAPDGRWSCWDHTGPAVLPSFPDRVKDLWPGIHACAVDLDGVAMCAEWDLLVVPDFTVPPEVVASEVLSLEGYHEPMIVRANDDRLANLSGACLWDGEPFGCRTVSGDWSHVEAGCYLTDEGELFCGGTEEDALQAAGL